MINDRYYLLLESLWCLVWLTTRSLSLLLTDQYSLSLCENKYVSRFWHMFVNRNQETGGEASRRHFSSTLAWFNSKWSHAKSVVMSWTIRSEIAPEIKFSFQSEKKFELPIAKIKDIDFVKNCQARIAIERFVTWRSQIWDCGLIFLALNTKT